MTIIYIYNNFCLIVCSECFTFLIFVYLHLLCVELGFLMNSYQNLQFKNFLCIHFLMTGDCKWQRVLNTTILWPYTIISIYSYYFLSISTQNTPNQHHKSTYWSKAIQFAWNQIKILLINWFILLF